MPVNSVRDDPHNAQGAIPFTGDPPTQGVSNHFDTKLDTQTEVEEGSTESNDDIKVEIPHTYDLNLKEGVVNTFPIDSYETSLTDEETQLT